MHNIDNNKIHYFNDTEIDKMLGHYQFTDKDAQKLIHILPIAKAIIPELLSGFYKFIFSFEHAKTFIYNDALMQKHKEGISAWFLALFSGTYDVNYFHHLSIISETHVKIGLPSHYVNTAFSYVRQFLEQILLENNHADLLPSMHKIIDINLDVLSLTYKEEKQQQLLKEVVLIKKVLKTKNVMPYLQPIIHNQIQKEAVKYECLMRLKDPDSGEIHSIYPYLHTAKSILLYGELMHIMVDKCFAIFQNNNATFSINLSYEDIVDTLFIDDLYAKIETFPNPERIIFEILETESIIDFDVVLSFILDVREKGCKIAIDDFGSGYSNIENILKFKPDYIKIDSSLIKNLNHSKESLSLVKNIINIAKDMQAKTIAEYVHSEEIYNIIKILDIDYLQGYYLGKPFPATQLN